MFYDLYKVQRPDKGLFLFYMLGGWEDFFPGSLLSYPAFSSHFIFHLPCSSQNVTAVQKYNFPPFLTLQMNILKMKMMEIKSH